MATIDLGKIKPVWKGTWTGSTAYEKNDMVLEGVNSYICTAAHTSSGTFSSDSANWDVMAYGAELPAQSGNAGLALKTDGTNLSWGTAGGVLQIKKYHYTGQQTIASTTYDNTNIAVTITPTASNSSFYIYAVIHAGPINHDSLAVFNVHDSQLGSSHSDTSQFCFPVTHSLNLSDGSTGYMSNFHSTGADSYFDDYRSTQSQVFGLYTPTSNNASARTFTVVCQTHKTTAANGININDTGSLQNDHGHQMAATSYIMVWEIANGIYS